MNFETVLRKQILAQKQTRRGKKLLELLDSPKTKARARKIERLKRHAAVEAGVPEDKIEEFDWSTLDWGKLFSVIFEMLLKFLPLLI